MVKHYWIMKKHILFFVLGLLGASSAMAQNLYRTHIGWSPQLMAIQGLRFTTGYRYPSSKHQENLVLEGYYGEANYFYTEDMQNDALKTGYGLGAEHHYFFNKHFNSELYALAGFKYRRLNYTYETVLWQETTQGLFEPLIGEANENLAHWDFKIGFGLNLYHKGMFYTSLNGGGIWRFTEKLSEWSTDPFPEGITSPVYTGMLPYLEVRLGFLFASKREAL